MTKVFSSKVRIPVFKKLYSKDEISKIINELDTFLVEDKTILKNRIHGYEIVVNLVPYYDFYNEKIFDIR